jgi:hypothetical protein
MIGKNIKLKAPDGTQKDLKEVRFIHFIFEKPNDKIIKYSEGQIRGNYHQIQFKFADDENSFRVSEKPPGQQNTAFVGTQAAYKGKSLFFSVDQSDKGAKITIASTTTDDGSKWDTVYEGVGANACEINIQSDGVQPRQYKLPASVVIKEEWGGNDDRNTWSPTLMTDANKQGLWKVVDSQTKNIAAEFKSQQEAQQFIDYLKKHPGLKPMGLLSEGSLVITSGPLPFPADPIAIGFNKKIAKYQDKEDHGKKHGRQELDIVGGMEGDGAHVSGAYVFYVRHNDKIGKDQYSLKCGWRKDDGVYEHINQLGGQGGGEYGTGWRWEANHNNYTESGKHKPDKINEQLLDRIDKRGLVADCVGQEQGFMLVKMRSPSSDATIYDVYTN